MKAGSPQSHSLNCPYCHRPGEITRVRCSPCGVELQGQFVANEFANLGADDLHLLRMFLQFEGRIRDMEAPLGLSYPTIRSRLGVLKEKVLLNPEVSAPVSAVQAVLDGLERGELSYDETLKQIRQMKKQKGEK